jgi:hypothetical protein
MSPLYDETEFCNNYPERPQELQSLGQFNYGYLPVLACDGNVT